MAPPRHPVWPVCCILIRMSLAVSHLAKPCGKVAIAWLVLGGICHLVGRLRMSLMAVTVGVAGPDASNPLFPHQASKQIILPPPKPL